MNDSTSFKNQLFVVLIPGGKILQLTNRIQKIISEHYEIYKEGSYPQIHITLNKTKKSKENKLIKSTDKLIKKWDKPVNIQVNNFECFNVDYNKFLVLKVEQSESLKKFAVALHKSLKEAGITVIDNYDSWNFHITIISNIFAENPISKIEFEKLCFKFNNITENDLTSASSKAKYLEIWRPTLDKDKKCIKSYLLN